MTDGITIEVVPSLDAQGAALRDWAGLLGDFSGFWRRVTDLTERAVAKNIESGGDWSGRSFPPLSAGYAAFKARHFPGRPILVQSGALRASLRSGGAGNLRRVGANLTDFGTALDYADDVAQEGRPPVRFRRDWNAVLVELYGAFVVLKMRAAGVPSEWVSGSRLARMAYEGADESALARAAARRLSL